MMNNGYDMNVPVPAKGSSKPGRKNPLREAVEGCPVGGSMFIRGIKQNVISATIAVVKRESAGSEYTTRKVTENGVEGYRFWRLK